MNKLGNLKAIDLLGRGIPITLLDGNEYKILYDLRAMAMLEDEMDEDTPLAKKLKDMLERQQPSWKAVLYLLWLGLLHYHPEIKREDIGQLVDVRMLPDLVNKISEALGQAMVEGESQEKKAVKDGSTGQSSTSSQKKSG